MVPYLVSVAIRQHDLWSDIREDLKASFALQSVSWDEIEPRDVDRYLLQPPVNDFLPMEKPVLSSFIEAPQEPSLLCIDTHYRNTMVELWTRG